MATGTSGGLLTTPKATSVFKHEILRQYSTVFLAKVASKSTGNRVMVVDGFAGRGQFEDGTPGSAALFMQAAASLTPRVRASIRLFEKNRADADHLATVASEFAKVGLDVSATCADVTDRLAQTVASAQGIPLFLLLDPCGQNLPFDVLTSALSGDRSAKWPPTEALLNLSADFTRRIGGVLSKGLNSAGLDTMDRMVGGSWWRSLALQVHASTPDGTWGAAADAVAREYARLLSAATVMGGAVVPVRRKPENQPTYHLVYLTRSDEGLWVMADALARARQKWLREVGPQDDDEQSGLFEVDPIGDKITQEQDDAARAARVRVLKLAADHHEFRLVDHVLEVFGDDYGLMSESTVGRVMRELKSERKLVREPGKSVHHATFTSP